ncbi:hypothetical protein [Phormidesmis priestleyi]|uniref:hypothetical protein n=1 Tax=Phormidesmis priestleyi TaxID=268141 RepID=UPI000ABF4BFB|nr:hypothetical protein [Phormidesmis priestleyi]
MVFRSDVATASSFTQKIAVFVTKVVTFVVNVGMFVAKVAVFTKNGLAIMTTT